MPRNDNQLDNNGRHSPGKQLWLVDDVAQYLRISTDAVYRMVERSEIPHTRIFKRRGLRFHPDEIEKWARLDRNVETLKDANG
jgi:excisionase family DNA binding protein